MPYDWFVADVLADFDDHGTRNRYLKPLLLPLISLLASIFEFDSRREDSAVMSLPAKMPDLPLRRSRFPPPHAP